MHRDENNSLGSLVSFGMLVNMALIVRARVAPREGWGAPDNGFLWSGVGRAAQSRDHRGQPAHLMTPSAYQ